MILTFTSLVYKAENAKADFGAETAKFELAYERLKLKLNV